MCPAQVLASQPSKRFKNTNCQLSWVVVLRAVEASALPSITTNNYTIFWNHHLRAQDTLESASNKKYPLNVLFKCAGQWCVRLSIRSSTVYVKKICFGAYWGSLPLRCGGCTGPIFTTASKGPAALLYPVIFLSKNIVIFFS
jgi:hypothetical protein